MRLVQARTETKMRRCCKRIKSQMSDSTAKIFVHQDHLSLFSLLLTQQVPITTATALETLASAFL